MKRANLLVILALTVMWRSLALAGVTSAVEADNTNADSPPPAPYYQSGEKGWFWYEQPPAKPVRQEKPEPQPLATTPPTVAAATVPAKPEEDPNDPLVRMKRVQETIERAQARAVLDPTPANVQAFMVANAQAQAQAARFAETWQQVLWQTPQLDYRLVKPADDQAIHAFNDARLAINEGFLREASQQYGLFFFSAAPARIATSWLRYSNSLRPPMASTLCRCRWTGKVCRNSRSSRPASRLPWS